MSSSRWQSHILIYAYVWCLTVALLPSTGAENVQANEALPATRTGGIFPFAGFNLNFDRLLTAETREQFNFPGDNSFDNAGNEQDVIGINVQQRNNLIAAAAVPQVPVPTQFVKVTMNSGLRR